MKLKKVKMTKAYFTNPRGYVIPVLHGTHISTVIADPKAFGLVLENIAETFKKHGETLGHEGYARDEILNDLLKKGWVHNLIIQQKENF